MKETQTNYVVTQDTASLFRQFNGNGDFSPGFRAAIEEYFVSIQRTLACGFDNQAQVIGFGENDISARLTEIVSGTLRADPNTYCICLDRYLVRDLEEEFPDRFFRFSITRTADDKKRPRCGADSFEEQLQRLQEKIPDIAAKKAIIVDDGIFSGGTITDTLRIIKELGVNITVGSVIGFIGPAEGMQFNGFPTQILNLQENLLDWIDIRDFGPYGGKTMAASKNNKVGTAIPYLFPWSEGEDASLEMSPNLFVISKEMILAFRKLTQEFEIQEYGQPLRFRDLVRAGFTMPVAKDRTAVPISINDRVTDYLDQCLKKIDEEQNRTVNIFDMDGTLYRLDGQNGGYKGSTLERKVYENAITFIKRKELCKTDEALRLYEAGIRDPLGLSQFLASRYQISRSVYFASAWDIDPTGIVQQYEIPVQTIRTLKQKADRKFVLLTSAPAVWAKRVLETIGLSDVFERIYTGEQFGTKDEVFRIFAGRYRPENVTSIGDQEKTDIMPAQRLGFRTLQVTAPADVANMNTV